MSENGVPVKPKIDESVIERFNEKWREREDGCWEWTAFIDEKGYGKLRFGDKYRRSHRVSYAIHEGRIPDGKQVNHHCDVKHCVNPDHLYAGTQSENIQDLFDRTDFNNEGERNPRAKLTEEDVREIREKYTGEYGNATELAEEYGVSGTQIIRIGKRKEWGSVE